MGGISDPILRARLLKVGLDLDQIPPLLRESDIVSDGKRVGLLPMTRPTFRKAVKDGFITKPVRLGRTSWAWRRHDIVTILLEGTAPPKRELRATQTAEQPRELPPAA
jgi:hypothetical protein